MDTLERSKIIDNEIHYGFEDLHKIQNGTRELLQSLSKHLGALGQRIQQMTKEQHERFKRLTIAYKQQAGIR